MIKMGFTKQISIKEQNFMYLLFRFLRLFFGPAPPDIIADMMVRKIAHKSFRFFRDEEIREMLNFSKIDQTEQDRIFNEIVLTGLCLAILMIEMLAKITESDNKKEYYKKLREELFIRYPEWLAELGVEKKYVKMWRKLIQMRCDEYEQDFREHRGSLPLVDEGNPWIPVVAIGGLDHLRRGKLVRKDPLFKRLLSLTTSVAIKIEKIIIHLA